MATTDSHSVGWRLRVLRTRKGMTLVELAHRAGLDISYLSRLERDVLQNAKPKPDTIDRVLQALDATPQEREAIYHHERAPLSPDEIKCQLNELAALEESSEMILLRDERWFVWYYNRAARAALGLLEEEYQASVGVHMLHDAIDPSVPRYYRIPDENREEDFSIRAEMFKATFAEEEFDTWYQQVVSHIYDFPWAVRLWEHPALTAQPLVIERQNMLIKNPQAGVLNVTVQLNHLMADPRYVIVTWAPADDATHKKIGPLVRDPRFAYDVSHTELTPRFLHKGELSMLGRNGF